MHSVRQEPSRALPPWSPTQVTCPVSIPDGSGFRPGPSGPTVVLFRLLLCLCRYAPDPEPADCPTGTTASEWGVDPAGTSPAVRPPTASCFRLPGTIPHIGVSVVTHGGDASLPVPGPPVVWSRCTARSVPTRPGPHERRSLFTDHPSSRTDPEQSASRSGMQMRTGSVVRRLRVHPAPVF
jgi:hypothetical protein